MSDVHPRTENLLRRVREAQDADGRLPVPEILSWEIFPFEGDFVVKRLEDPVLPEPPRSGEGGVDCRSCSAGTSGAIWADERWKLVPSDRVSVPVVLLCPLDHHDMHDLPLHLASELGVLAVRVENALRSLGGVGRVHMDKWADGGAHLHVWFFARPEGLLQLRGSTLPDWTDCLPPMPEVEWDGVMAAVAAEMAVQGGRALVT